jgi:hypothetical protein
MLINHELSLFAPMSILKIDDCKSVSDFQKEFNRLFPYLKIEFFKTATDKFESKNYKANLPLAPNYLIDKKGSSMEVNSSTTVAQLKNLFFENLGVKSLIYRKSGTMWIETSLTEDWTLHRQNHEAELMNNHSI